MIRVQYPTGSYDYVGPKLLDRLIEKRGIRQFYRPSEQRWIDIAVGPLRKREHVIYLGPERRRFTQAAA